MRNRSVHARGLARGFSMLELTLVLAMIGILLAVASFSFMGTIGRSKTRATEATLRTVEVALNDYHMTHNVYPPDLRTLVSAKFLKDGTITDGWKKDLVYGVPGRDKDHPYVLGSAGENGTTGDEDDIDVWTIGTKGGT